MRQCFVLQTDKKESETEQTAGFSWPSWLEKDSLADLDGAHSRRVMQQVNSAVLPKDLSFAGEKVPFEDFDVQERMERELLVNMYWHSSTVYMFKLSGRYFPEIEAILAKHGVPDDFKFLAMAESGLRNQISPAKAVGFWQMLESTGKEYGLHVGRQVDERYDYVRSTEAA